MAEHEVYATNKGGVGKTLWVLELAAALGRKGRKVLVVDCDPQANLTRRMKVQLDDDSPTLTTVLQQGLNASTAIQPCGWNAPEAETIDVLPSDIDLELRVLEAGAPGALLRLRKSLDDADRVYDHIMYDCPPSLGHLTQLAIAAAGRNKKGRVYLPIIPEKDAIRGAQRTRQFVEEYAPDLYAEGIVTAGVLINMVRGTALHKQRRNELAIAFGESEVTGRAVEIWDPYISQVARIAELHDEGRPTSTDRDLVRDGVVANFDAIALRMESA